MTDDLFAAAAGQRLARRAPLADRLRPVRLDDVVGQAHLVGGAPAAQFSGTLLEVGPLLGHLAGGLGGLGLFGLERRHALVQFGDPQAARLEPGLELADPGPQALSLREQVSALGLQALQRLGGSGEPAVVVVQFAGAAGHLGLEVVGTTLGLVKKPAGLDALLFAVEEARLGVGECGPRGATAFATDPPAGGAEPVAVEGDEHRHGMGRGRLDRLIGIDDRSVGQ